MTFHNLGDLNYLLTLMHPEFRFKQLFPSRFFLKPSVEDITDYLRSKVWLMSGETIESMEKPGEGNMNCVLRVRSNLRTFILKQARPWVEKYPHIDAPVERNRVEATYFALMDDHPELRNLSPQLLHTDPENFLIMVSDLGQGSDYTFLYSRRKLLTEKELKDLGNYLSHLHGIETVTFPENKAMRELNHEHIFHFPFLENNGLELDGIQEGLQKASLPIKKDEVLKSKIKTLGELYLTNGDILIHGDYYPGSWLAAKNGLKVIDPEFSFKGFPEFDLGVLIAHLTLTGHASRHFKLLSLGYPHFQEMKEDLIAGFAGTEILRRLLGVAQLPLKLSLDEKRSLMEMASFWVTSGTIKQALHVL